MWQIAVGIRLKLSLTTVILNMLPRPIRHEALSGFALMPELGRVDIETLKLHVYPEPQLQAKWQADLGEKTGHVSGYLSLINPPNGAGVGISGVNWH